MHPQAIIVDSSLSENNYFLRTIREQAPIIGSPLIELPEHAVDRLRWLTKLDSMSLAGMSSIAFQRMFILTSSIAWNKVNIDILIQAPHDSSGGLIRLLRSLSAADYTSSPVPHLTIELPQKIDPPTEKFLETFQWPPARVPNPSNVQQLSLRHRIPRRGISEEESSIRFLESFWPARPKDQHILVLSPQVELSRYFFHCKRPYLTSCLFDFKNAKFGVRALANPIHLDLKYNILEYKYSNAAAVQEWDARLLAVSLEMPSTHVDGSGSFSPPPRLEPAQSAEKSGDKETSFLWQAPNSNAALFFGDKWVELHGFVSQLLEIQRNLPTPPEMLAQKLVSKKFPSWLEHALRLSRVRGYWTLYPSQITATNLATVHNELYNAPEEYEKEISQDTESSNEITLARGGLLDSLPDGGTLMPFHDLPLLSWSGKPTKLKQMNDDALSFATEFKRSVGGCTTERTTGSLPDKSARDLFCTSK